jgi:hypothetical protein
LGEIKLWGYQLLHFNQLLSLLCVTTPRFGSLQALGHQHSQLRGFHFNQAAFFHLLKDEAMMYLNCHALQAVDTICF